MRLLTCLFSFCLCHSVFSQIFDNPPIQFGKIPPADLSMTGYEADSSAEAVVLCDYETVNITVGQEVLVRKERHVRIKVLSKNGFGYGDVKIPFYSHDKDEQFYFNKAAIYQPNGNFTELKKKDVFIEQKNKYWSQARFAFPKMSEGCIIEYAYYINSNHWYQPEDWFFQGKTPARHSEIRIVYPPELEYTYFFQGNEGMKKIKDEEKLTVLEGRNGRCTIKPSIFVFENAPAMKRESYITTMNDYRARVRFQLSKIRYRDGRVNEVTTSWKELKKELAHSPYFGYHYLKKGHYKSMTEPLMPAIDKLSSNKEKAAFIYSHITQKMNWNGRHNRTAGQTKIKEVYSNNDGNSAQINLMLLAFLREAGIEAAPVLTSTRSHGKMYEDFPLLDQFDHLLIAAEIDGETVFLDGTDPLRPMGFPDPEALNSRGWNMDKGWIDIKSPKEGIDVFMADLTLSEDGTVAGKMVGSYRGYNAIPERRRHAKEEGKHWDRRFSERFTEVDIEKIGNSDPLDLEQRFTDTVHFTIQQAAMATGDHLYFSPVLYSNFNESPFKLKDRNYPVDFPYSMREQHIIHIKLPAGYAVEELPKSIRTTLPNNGGSFVYAIDKKTPGQLSFNIMMNVQQLKFYPEEYSMIKELFDLFVEKIGEQVVLKRL